MKCSMIGHRFCSYGARCKGGGGGGVGGGGAVNPYYFKAN